MVLMISDATIGDFYNFIDSVYANNPKNLETEFQNFKSFIRIDYFVFQDDKSSQQNNQFFLSRMPSSPTSIKNAPEFNINLEEKVKLPPKIFDLKYLIETLIAQTVMLYKILLNSFYKIFMLIKPIYNIKYITLINLLLESGGSSL